MPHIPKGTTHELTLPPFEEELALALQPQKDYDSTKWLYVPCTYAEYRYILGTVGKKPLICIGINPSTARPGALDNTLKSVERLALSAGFDSFIMFNLYPERATDPDSMERERNERLHEANMAAFEYILGLSEDPTVWAAWGAIIEKRPYLFSCMEEMVRIGEKHGARWVTCGKRSVKGHPHHPLYLKNGSPLDAFDAADYAMKFKT